MPVFAIVKAPGPTIVHWPCPAAAMAFKRTNSLKILEVPSKSCHWAAENRSGSRRSGVFASGNNRRPSDDDDESRPHTGNELEVICRRSEIRRRKQRVHNE